MKEKLYFVIISKKTEVHITMFPEEDFMLKGKTAKRLFSDYAEKMPIIDYHCHLDPKQIAENKNFKSITELMLGGDHYKWRAMRTCGIDEKFITGDADDREKFRQWAKTITYSIGNPLYHWTHLELSRYFGITVSLTEENADEVFDKCNLMLQEDSFKPQSLIARSNVEIICTTDSPTDDLQYHKALAESFKECKVLPTFRPDAVIEIANAGFAEYISKAGIKSYSQLIDFITDRIEYFNGMGCRLADHGLGTVPYALGNPERVFEKVMNGKTPDEHETDVYRTALIGHCAKQYCKYGWTMQLHIGAMRNNNTAMFNRLGADSGFDSINDLSIAQPLSRLMDMLEADGHLPKTILYNLNPKDNYVLASMLGNFQCAPFFGKIQFGSGWWFNDQRDGIENQIKTLANLGVLGTFIGMLTDSRSLVSYPRHEYFRRILCSVIGQWVDSGEYPDDQKALEKIVKGICYNNAKSYFNF